MRKELTNFVVGALISGSLFFAGCSNEKDSKYVLLSPLPISKPVGEYNTLKEAQIEGVKIFGCDSFDVKKMKRDEKVDYSPDVDKSTPSQEELRKNLPGRAFKENVFEDIEKKRYFDKRGCKRSIVKVERGITFYDLDKDGYIDIVAKMDPYSTFAKIVFVFKEFPMPGISYADLDNDSILEVKSIMNGTPNQETLREY